MAGLSSSYPIYAPVADLTAYLGTEPADAEGLIERASGVVRSMTRTAFYNVDPADGFTPTLERIKNAFHDATILQAAGFVRAGVTPGDLVATQTPGIASKSLGGRSVTYAQDASATVAKNELLNGALTPEAASVLQSNGLLNSSVAVGAGTSYDILLRRWV